jgi:branched-chain amino acid transport system ATP-binding protein
MSTVLKPAVAPAAVSVQGSAIEVRQLTLTYGEFRVLDDLTLTLPADGIIGLIGPNGAGKSTLLSVVAGFMAPRSGEVRFDGQVITRLSADARARRGLVRTFQVPREFKHLTVMQNLLAAPGAQVGESLAGLLFQRGRIRQQEAELREQAFQWLRFLKLETVADQPAGGLSGGQKKLLEIGRLLMLQPRCMLLDEPYAGVNPVLIEQISERLRELHQRGLGLVIVEHNLHMLAQLAQRLVVLERGRLLAEGEPGAVLADAAVRAAYMGN